MRTRLAACSAALALAVAAAAHADQYFLRVGTIQGSVPGPGAFQDHSELLSVADAALPAAGAPIDRSEITVLKLLDDASPHFWFDSAQGTVFADAELNFTAGGGAPYLTIDLSGVVISEYALEWDDGSGVFIERIGLRFQQIQWLDGGASPCWNRQTQKAC